MPNENSHQFYSAYVTNVRDFLIAETEIRRTINRALKINKPLTVKVQTKIYALLFSTFSEANFMKLVLTPYGFEQDHVNQILRQESIQEKWLKCLELAFLKFTHQKKNSEAPNRSLELKRIIQNYIVDPSVLRNKIAHGQFTVAMNSKGTNLNPKTTNLLEELNFVTIQRWFEINKRLASIIEDLIESPDYAHHKFYYPKYQALVTFIERSSAWTVESKLSTASLQRTTKYFVSNNNDK